MKILDYDIIPIPKEQIYNDKTISWTIKYDLLQDVDVFIVKDVDITIYNIDVQKIRKYNKDNYPNGYFIFNLHSDKLFYIKRKQTSNTIPQVMYDDTILEYAYNSK